MKKLLLLALVALGGVMNVCADDVIILKGSWDTWTEHTMTNITGTTRYTYTQALSANQTPEFGVDVNGAFYKNGGTMTWDNCTDWPFGTDASNCKISTNDTGAGDYIFTWDNSTKHLTVTYPNLETVYFYNNHSWTNVYVYFLGSSYWDSEKGSGSSGRRNGYEMSKIGDSNIYEISYPESFSSKYIAFVKNLQNNYGNFDNTEAVYKENFNSTTPLYVPNTSGPVEMNKRDNNTIWTAYWNDGEWYSYPTYTRPVTSGNFGTICLPFSGTVSGATLYQIDSKIEVNNQLKGINISEAGTSLSAGQAYIFKASGSELTVSYLSGDFKVAATGGAIVGNYTSSLAVETGKYIIKDNKLWDAGTGVTIGQYRAYIDLDKVTSTTSRGANSIFFGDDATGIESVQNENSENVMFNMQGQRVNNAQKGLVIVGGKKMLRK